MAERRRLTSQNVIVTDGFLLRDHCVNIMEKEKEGLGWKERGKEGPKRTERERNRKKSGDGEEIKAWKKEKKRKGQVENIRQ